MWVVGIVLLVHGAFVIVHGLDCMLETLKCSENRVAMEPNKNLMETPEAFDHMCMQQELFYGCLQNVALSQDSILPPALLHSKLMTEELCSKDSEWRRSYLAMASCINKQHTDFCTSTDFLIAATYLDDGPENPDLRREKSYNCIAAILTMNCDIEAGKIFNYLRKISSYDRGSVDLKVVTSCDGDLKENDTQKLNEIYSGLLRKMGDIPEQNEENAVRFDESLEDGVDEMASIFMEDFSDTKISHNHNKNKTLSSETTVPEHDAFVTESVSNLNVQQHISSNPTAPRDENEVPLFYHPDGRVSFYWRESSSSVDSIMCQVIARGVSKVADTFHCRVTMREKDPQCSDDSSALTEDKITPEEIDPELGAKFYETYPKVTYPFQDFIEKNMDSDTVEYLSTSQFPDSEDNSEVHVEMDYIKDIEKVSKPTESDLERELSAEFLLNHDLNKSGYSVKVMESSTLYNTQDEDLESVTAQPLNYETSADDSLRTNIIDKFVEVFTTASQTPTNNKHAEALREGMKDLFTSEQTSALQYPEMIYSADGSIDLYWSNKETSPINSIICGRVNECHPKAGYVFKCLIVPKQEQETSVNSEYHEVEDLETSDEFTTMSASEYHAGVEDADLSEYLNTSHEYATVVSLADDETEIGILEPTEILNSMSHVAEVDESYEQELELSPDDFQLFILGNDFESSDSV